MVSSSLVIKENSPFKRKITNFFRKIIFKLELFSGNILRQPIMKNKVFKKIKNAEEEANKVMKMVF